MVELSPLGNILEGESMSIGGMSPAIVAVIGLLSPDVDFTHNIKSDKNKLYIKGNYIKKTFENFRSDLSRIL